MQMTDTYLYRENDKEEYFLGTITIDARMPSSGGGSELIPGRVANGG